MLLNLTLHTSCLTLRKERKSIIMTKNSSLPSFYSKDLKDVRNNAKKIAEHPILGNIDHITKQLNSLRASHRQFIFASLTPHFGEMKARDIVQTEKVKQLVHNFDDLDLATAKDLEKEAEAETKNFIGKFKLGVFDTKNNAQQIHTEVIKSMRNELPDLLKATAIK